MACSLLFKAQVTLKEDLSMKALTSKKAIIAIMSLGSIVLAGTIKDLRSHSVKIEEIEAGELEATQIERNVASEAVSRVAQIYLPKNAENERKINTVWEITRIVGADEKVSYDKRTNPEDAKRSIQVNFELLGTSLVKVNDDIKLVYNVSLLSDFGTIALFKKIGNGYEILEAKRVALAVNNNLVVSDEVELVLERALNQSKSNKVLTGNDVSGQVSLSKKAITGLEVNLTNESGETQNIQIDHADLMDGGAFKAEINGEEVSGVVLNNGKEGYRVSFVTGPMAGAMLNFTTKEQADKIQENERDQMTEPQVDAPSPEEVQVATEKVIEERKDTASDVGNMEPVVLTAEQVKATAEQNGFAF